MARSFVSSTVKILLLDFDKQWCEVVSEHLEIALEDEGYQPQISIATDFDTALVEIEAQSPSLVISSERLNRRKKVNSDGDQENRRNNSSSPEFQHKQGLLFFRKLNRKSPGTLKILILDRELDDAKHQEAKNLTDEYWIDHVFQRSKVSLNVIALLDAVIQLLMNMFENGYALLIGVGADLPVTVKDAQALYAVLSDPNLAAYPPNNIELLVDQEATRDNILAGLDQLASQANKDKKATVTIYFSGHGGCLQETEDYFLVPNDADRTNLRTCSETSISGKELTQKINAIQAQKLIFWLDCCHAGGMIEKGLELNFIKSPPDEDLIAALSLGSGRVVVASSKKDQVSYVGNPYSVFTACLLDALKGGAKQNSSSNYVRIFEVLSYLLQEVPKRAPKLQEPIISRIDDLSEDFPICLRPKLIRSEVSPDTSQSKTLDVSRTSTPNNVVRNRKLERLKEDLENLLEERRKLRDLLKKLRQKRLYEDYPTTAGKLDEDISQKEEYLDKLEKEIEQLEEEINNLTDG